MADKKQKAKKQPRSSGVVKNNVVWVSEESAYREVLDDSGPDVKLGDEVHSVIDNKRTGQGHFEYGPPSRGEA